MVTYVHKSRIMENLPPTVILFVATIGMAVVAYFLKRRDAAIDSMSTERKQVDVVLNAKIDTVLKAVENISTRLTKIETNQGFASKELLRIENNQTKMTAQLAKTSGELSVVDKEIGILLEWKKSVERMLDAQK